MTPRIVSKKGIINRERKIKVITKTNKNGKMIGRREGKKEKGRERGIEEEEREEWEGRKARTGRKEMN